MKFELNSTSDKNAKIKLGVIPVLALVLAYVLFAPSETSDAPVATQQQQFETSTSQAPASQSKADDPVVKEIHVPMHEKLPNISLAEMVDHDPFQVLRILRPEVVAQKIDGTTVFTSKSVESQARKQERLEQLKQKLKSHVVGGIFVAGNKKAAVIDSKVYHEGDLLEEGIRIQRIDRRHVVLVIEGEDRISLH